MNDNIYAEKINKEKGYILTDTFPKVTRYRNVSGKEYYINEITYDNRVVFPVRDIMPIIDFEKTIWGENSDNDLFREKILYKIITVQNGNFILAYCIISVRNFYKGSLSKRTYYNLQEEISSEDNKDIGLDIEDLVVVNTRTLLPYVEEFKDKIINTIKDIKHDFIVMNPNHYSKPLLKRLKKELPDEEIKFYNYPEFDPYGYEKVKSKENTDLCLTEDHEIILDYFNQYYNHIYNKIMTTRYGICSYDDIKIQYDFSKDKRKYIYGGDETEKILVSMAAAIATKSKIKINKAIEIIIYYKGYLPDNIKSMPSITKIIINNL